MEKRKQTGFFFQVEREKIVDVHPYLDYAFYRSIEELVETQTLEESLNLVCKACRTSPFSQQLCFVQGIETLARIEVPLRAKFIRTIVSELERISEHLFWLGVIGYEVGLSSLQSHISNDQQLILKLVKTLFDLQEGWCKINVIGGAQHDIIDTPIIVDKISKRLDMIEDQLSSYEDLILEEKNIGVRFKEVSVLDTKMAKSLGAVGPLARASGLQMDVRKNDTYAAFETIDFELVSFNYGDVLARILVILQEAYESIHIVRTALRNLPKGEIRTPHPEWMGPGEQLSRTEASQGELLNYLRITSNKLERLKVRPPALANLASLLEILKNSYIADIPVVIASVDPSFFYTDLIILKESTGNKYGYSREELRNYGICWYKSKKQLGSI
ncbi:MAG: hypothetical protein ACE5R6_15315 [Candidatus Heimdallarchaeota archaeon]